MAWINTAASISLRNEMDNAFPDRDTASDGTIGDGEHAQSVSDHNPDETGNTGGVEDSDSINEVHARDVDKDVRRAGWSMERVVQIILARCRSGAETRLRYIIFNRRIWSASSDWTEREYTGSNPHDHHAHFSFKYGSGASQTNPENRTMPWGILAAIEAEADMTPEQMTLWAKSSAGRQALALAAGDALAAQRALALTRLKDRGWGGADGMSQDEILAYILESTVAPANIDADGDGQADDSASLQGRLGRVEAALAEVLSILKPATPAVK